MEENYNREKDKRYYPLFSCPRKTTTLAWFCKMYCLDAERKMEEAQKLTKGILRLKEFHPCKDFGLGSPECKKSQAEAETLYRDGLSYLKKFIH